MPGFGITGDGPSHTIETHRTHRWRVVQFGYENVVGGATRNKGQSPLLYAKSLSLPTITFEEEKVNSSNLVYKVAKRANWQNVTLRMYDVYRHYQKIEAWRKKIWTPEQGIGLACDYKGQAIFIQYDGMGRTKRTYKLHGAYPSSINHGELSYTDSDIKIIEITYSYDFAEITINE
jgi:hypothetical protein